MHERFMELNHINTYLLLKRFLNNVKQHGDNLHLVAEMTAGPLEPEAWNFVWR
jgi:hypothetical protein